ncbi:MAG: outer membrane beta-barrel family protein [Sediminibacterium sp.]
MKKIFTLSVSCILFSILTLAQNVAKISGVVKDEQGKALQSATVSLLHTKDSSLAKLAVSDQNGRYEMNNSKPGKYFVSVVLVGYAKAGSNAFDLASTDIIVPALTLRQSTREMNEVVVQSKKPFIETKIDRTVVNVEASPSSAGATAMEILEKSPGVSVSSDGSISLRGKAGVIVMLDGKPTYMSSSDLANLLKNMPASSLDQVEIMTNPSARYDASGNSGIINIKTKKGKNNGFNGSFTLGISAGIFQPKDAVYITPKSQNSFNFNYRHNKINLFGSYNPNYFRGRGELSIDRNFTNAGTFDGSSSLLTNFKFGNFNQTLKLGLDYQADKKNVFGVVVSGFAFDGHPTPVTATTLRDKNGAVQSNLISLTENKTHFKNFTGNLNWKHTFDSTGKELTADLDYVTYDNISDVLLTTNVFNGSGTQVGNAFYLNGHIPSLIDIWSFKSDYTQPLKNGRFEAGVKSSIVTNNNKVDYSRQLPDKSWSPDARSNHFIYDENINAAYVNLNKQFKKWSVQGGLRLENTVAKGRQVSNDSTFKRNFTNLFPSLFVSYAADKNNQFTVSYSRRITRPNYQDLNPFTYFLDSLTYRVGNPYLLPQFTHNIELSYALKSKFIFTANYNNTTDVISQIIKQNTASKITYNTSENVARFTNIGLSVTAPANFTPWWNANFFTNIYNNHYVGVYNKDPIDIAFTSFMVNITNSFTFNKSKGFTGEVSGFYRYKSVDQLSISEPVYQIGFALQKTVMQGKGTVRLNVRDPFAWQKFISTVNYSDIDLRSTSQFDVRQVTATFTYRFGKNTPGAQPRRRTSGSQEEQNRVGGGN